MTKMIAKDSLLIGLGQIGMGYDLLIKNNYIFTHAKAISSHEDFNLVAAVDKSSERRKQFTEKYQLPVYENLEDALINLDVSVVIIATPTKTHEKILELILMHLTPELILCEKPLAYDLDAATKMLNMCQEKDIMLYVNYMRRSEIGALHVKQMISTNIIETPLKGFAWYTKGLMNNGSHFLNLLEYWLGPIISTKTLSQGQIWNEIDPEYDFIATFELGEIIFSSCNEQSSTYNSVEMIGPSGRLHYIEGGEIINWHEVSPDPILNGHSKLSVLPKVIENNMHQYQYSVYQEISNALNGLDYNLCSAVDALNTLKHIDKLGEKNE